MKPSTPGAALSPGLVMVGRGIAALAVAMGVGRFGYTPILPRMVEQAGLTNGEAASLATANYLGYLVGSVIALVAARTTARAGYRASLAAIVASLAIMPLTSSFEGWFLVRFIAGVASAIVLIAVMESVASGRTGLGRVAGGAVFSGIGLGIAATGSAMTTSAAQSSWEGSWVVLAGLALVLTVVAWAFPTSQHHTADPEIRIPPRRLVTWSLTLSYFFNGMGYIIAGTFLVAAVGEGSSPWMGDIAWVVVGLAAMPSSAACGWLSRFVSQLSMLRALLLVQALGVLLPVLANNASTGLLMALSFGATFQAIAVLTIAVGHEVGMLRATAMLTTVFSIGQSVGPLVATPMLSYGYTATLLLASSSITLSLLMLTPLRSKARKAADETQ